MTINGAMFIAGEASPGDGEPFAAREAATGRALDPDFRCASPAQLERALAAADRIAMAFGDSEPMRRANLLDAIGEAIIALGDELIDRAMVETGLPRQRLEGERNRTVTQLRLFSTLLREGDFTGVRIDRADPTRATGPKPDLRLSKIALGPVAIFGASNFPLAFSVAGGDTASALAAGCPVIVKGHPAHPGTGELVARAVTNAVAEAGFDPGIFSFLHDGGIRVGEALVADSRVKAVGFTGSRRAGEALMAIASRRAELIPVFAEMSATNPVILMPFRLEEAPENIAAAFVGSLTLGTGQFCTNPGLVLMVDGPACDRFLAAAAQAIWEWTPAIMLTPEICSAFDASTQALGSQPGVAAIAASRVEELRATARLFSTDAATFIANSELRHEMFGPAALIIRCRDVDEIANILTLIEGQLTIAVHFNDADHDDVARLLPIARRKAGRVLANGFGTGVEVSPAMMHGGPYPSTSDGRTTSVGTMAIERFLRPVCLQDFPENLLPIMVSDKNPWNLPRRTW